MPSPKGRLTINEKYQIKGMLHDGKPVSQIAKLLRRQASTISRYINGELDELSSTIVNAQLEQCENKTEEVVEEVQLDLPKNETTPSIVEDAILQVMENQGLPRQKAEVLIYKVLRSTTDVYTNVKQLARDAGKKIGVFEIMQTTTSSGRDGIAIMNRAASMRGDSKKTASTNEKFKNSIHRPKE